MRQLKVTIPDDFYGSFIDYLKDKPQINVAENEPNEIPKWQQDMVLERVKNYKPEDYIDARVSLNKIKAKYGFDEN